VSTAAIATLKTSAIAQIQQCAAVEPGQPRDDRFGTIWIASVRHPHERRVADALVSFGSA
jgi:hypothetical protein